MGEIIIVIIDNASTRSAKVDHFQKNKGIFSINSISLVRVMVSRRSILEILVLEWISSIFLLFASSNSFFRLLIFSSKECKIAIKIKTLAPVTKINKIP